MSKGHAPRPFSIPLEQFGTRHEAIFGKRERVQYVPPCSHEHTIAREDDDAAIMRCIACGEAVQWLHKRRDCDDTA